MGATITGFALIGGLVIGGLILWWSWLSMVLWGVVAHSVDASYFLSFKTAITYVGLAGALFYGIPLGLMLLFGFVMILADRK